jgi:diguanylate cyclase (GGDEF)-like protein
LLLVKGSDLSSEERAMLEMIPAPISILAPVGEGMAVVARNERHVRFFADTPEPSLLSEHGARCLASGSETVFEAGCFVGGVHRPVRFHLKPNREGRVICVTEDLTERSVEPSPPESSVPLRVIGPLHGVMSSQRFMDAALREVKRVARHSSPLALVRIDIDRRHAASTGADALRSVAAVLKAGIRDSDLLARVGDGSFAVLLVHTDGEHGRAVIERLRETISIRSAMLQDPASTLTISAGVVEYGSPEPFRELLRRAETALSKAKADGWDRVRLD